MFLIAVSASNVILIKKRLENAHAKLEREREAEVSVNDDESSEAKVCASV